MQRVFSSLERNPRTIEAIRREYAETLNESNKIVQAAKAAKRDLSQDENAKLEGLIMQMGVQSAEENQLRAQSEQRSQLERALNSGEIAIPENLRGSGYGSSSATLTTPSGKQQRYAVGASQRLSLPGDNPPPFAVASLLTCAAVGAKSWTNPDVVAQFRGDDNSAGGYSIPEAWLADWVDKIIEQSVLAVRASRTIMSTESLNITVVENHPVMKTKAELEKFNETGIGFGNRRLQPWTGGCTILASIEALSDSPNAPAQIQSTMMRSIADWFDYILLAGTGANEPFGILNRDIPEEASVGALDWEAIGDAVTTIRQSLYKANLVVLSPAQYNAMMLLTTGDGTNAAKQYLEPPKHLAGLEFAASVHCPDTVALVCDPEQMLLGIREGAVAEASPYAGESFERNGVTLRCKMRADMVPLDNAAFFALRGLTLS